MKRNEHYVVPPFQGSCDVEISLFRLLISFRKLQEAKKLGWYLLRLLNNGTNLHSTQTLPHSHVASRSTFY